MLIRSRIIYSIAGIAFVVVAAAGAIALPAASSINASASAIISARQAIEQRYRTKDDARASLEGYRRAQTDIFALNDLAIHEGKELDFVSALESAAERNGLTQELSLDTANQTLLNDWEKIIPVKIRVAGRFDDVIRYLGDIERLPQALAIDGGDIRTLPQFAKTNPEGRIEAIIDGRILWIGNNAPSFATGNDTPGAAAPL